MLDSCLVAFRKHFDSKKQINNNLIYSTRMEAEDIKVVQGFEGLEMKGSLYKTIEDLGKDMTRVNDKVCSCPSRSRYAREACQKSHSACKWCHCNMIAQLNFGGGM